MKVPKLQDFLLWKGKLAKIIARADRPTYVIELIESCKCPHCKGDLGKKQISVIPESPLFQENAEPVPTISNDHTLV